MHVSWAGGFLKIMLLEQFSGLWIVKVERFSDRSRENSQPLIMPLSIGFLSINGICWFVYFSKFLITCKIACAEEIPRPFFLASNILIIFMALQF